jgi:hypothetical protein
VVWTVTDQPDWVTVSPSSLPLSTSNQPIDRLLGQLKGLLIQYVGSDEVTVTTGTVTVRANPGAARSGQISFTGVSQSATLTKTVTIRQNAAPGAAQT